MIPDGIRKAFGGKFLDTNKHPTVLWCSPEPIGYGCLCSSLASEHICTHEVMRFWGRFAQTQRPHLRPKPKSMTCTIWIRGPTPNLRNFHRPMSLWSKIYCKWTRPPKKNSCRFWGKVCSYLYLFICDLWFLFQMIMNSAIPGTSNIIHIIDGIIVLLPKLHLRSHQLTPHKRVLK